MSLSAKSFSLFQRDIFLFITNLITGVVVARKLGPSALGLLVILQMIPVFADAFGRTKVDAAAVYILGRKKYEIGDVVFTLNAVGIITSMLIVAAVLWQFDRLYTLLFANSETDVRFFMYLILLQIPFDFLFMNYMYLYIYREDVGIYNRMVMIKSLVSSVVGITLLLVFDVGLVAVVVAPILAVMSGLIYGVAKFGPTGTQRYAMNFPLVKELFGYGFTIYLAGIIAQLNAYFARLIMVFHLSPAQVAYFSMAQNQGQLLNKIPDALNAMLYPRIAKTESNDVSAKLAAQAFRVILLILTGVGSLAFFLIEPMVQILYGKAFLTVVLPFRIILPGLVISGAATVINQYFSGIGRADIGTKVAIVPLFIQVIAGLLLIPGMGLVGAALAFVFALLSIAFIQILIFLRISNCTLNDLLFQRKDFQTVIVFIRSIVKKYSAKR